MRNSLLLVLGEFELMILEKNEEDIFMLEEMNYDDLKKIITKRTNPDLIIFKTSEKEIPIESKESQQILKALNEKVNN